MSNRYIISGPEPLGTLPEGCLGKILFDSLLNGPSGDALVDGYSGRTLTYESLLHQSCRLAEALRKIHVHSETNVAICCENSLEFFVPVLACLYIGAVVVPINHCYMMYEIDHCLNMSQPSVVFCSRTLCKNFIEKNDRNRDNKFEIIIMDYPEDKTINGTVNMNEFLERHLGKEEINPSLFRPFDEGNTKEHVAVILSSSGTTGVPKGVMLTHRNIIVRIAQSREPNFMAPDGVVLGLMPFFHGYGFNFGLISIYNHDKIVVLRRFEPDVFLKTIQDHKITSLALAPPLVVFMGKSPKLDEYDLSHVKEVYCGSAPLSSESEDLLKKRLKINIIRQAYGMTESCLAVTVIMPGDRHKSGSCGRVVSYMQMKVMDTDTGDLLGPNDVGEIYIKGQMVMKGYYKNDMATEEVLSEDGWLKTGDLGYYDRDKYFYIVGRLKELIKYNGYQVAPAELESILLNHPYVVDVGVIGIPDESAGELPMAFVVKKEKSHVTEEQLQDYVANIVSAQKRLRGGVIFVSKIPRNASGKIKRQELKWMFEQHEKDLETKL